MPDTPLPHIPIMPLPLIVDVGTEEIEGKAVLILRFSTPQGESFYYVAPEQGAQLAQVIAQAVKEVAMPAGLIIPTIDPPVHLNGDGRIN